MFRFEEAFYGCSVPNKYGTDDLQIMENKTLEQKLRWRERSSHLNSWKQSATEMLLMLTST